MASNLVKFPNKNTVQESTNNSSKISLVMTGNGYHAVKSQPSEISFNRDELDAILRVYGFMVGESEWKDYAIDHLKDRAVFSIFKRTGEFPFYRIEKNPKLAQKQGAYCIIAANGSILKRGKVLKQVLKYFEKKLQLINS